MTSELHTDIDELQARIEKVKAELDSMLTSRPSPLIVGITSGLVSLIAMVLIQILASLGR